MVINDEEIVLDCNFYESNRVFNFFLEFLSFFHSAE